MNAILLCDDNPSLTLTGLARDGGGKKEKRGGKMFRSESLLS
jgi:hypothetical protein